MIEVLTNGWPLAVAVCVVAIALAVWDLVRRAAAAPPAVDLSEHNRNVDIRLRRLEHKSQADHDGGEG